MTVYCGVIFAKKIKISKSVILAMNRQGLGSGHTNQLHFANFLLCSVEALVSLH